VKDGRIFEQSAAMDKWTNEEIITEIMIQRDDAILKNGRLYVELQEANKKLGELDTQCNLRPLHLMPFLNPVA
jgi:hypothetical protein